VEGGTLGSVGSVETVVKEFVGRREGVGSETVDCGGADRIRSSSSRATPKVAKLLIVNRCQLCTSDLIMTLPKVISYPVYFIY
jgi:hypothetical protein